MRNAAIGGSRYSPFHPWVPLLRGCKEVEDENDDEDENDWGSGGREPSIAGIVCMKAIDQSGQHCYNTRDHFRYRVPPSFFPSPIVLVLVVVLVLGLWLACIGHKSLEICDRCRLWQR